MKKVLLLLLSVSTLAVFAASAKSIVRNTPKVNKARVSQLKKNWGTGLNEIYFQLNYKQTTDVSYQPSSSQSAYSKVVFDNAYSSDIIGPEDQGLPPFGMGGEQLTILQMGNYLSIQGRQLPTTMDTIQLDIQGLSAVDYQLQIDPTGFTGNGMVAFLYDAYLKKAIALSDTIYYYNFVPTLANAATYQDRFTIIFKKSTLPITNIYLSAVLKDGEASINWKTIGESNVARYDIEKSTDGNTFHTINSISAKNAFAASYTYTDVNILSGNSYYRIKVVSNKGEVTYSKVSTITKSNTSSVGIYPNPLINNVVNVKFTDAASGKYLLSVINSLGQRMFSKEIQHSGGTASYSSTLNNNVANGMYKVSVVSATTGKAVYETNILIAK